MAWIPVCRPSKYQLSKAIKGGICPNTGSPIYIGRVCRNKNWIMGKVIDGELAICESELNNYYVYYKFELVLLLKT